MGSPSDWSIADPVPASGRLVWMTVAFGVLASGVLIIGTAAAVGLQDDSGFVTGLRAALLLWGPYLLSAPAIFWLARRLPLDAGVWPRNLATHIALSLAYAAVCEMVNSALRPHPPRPPGMARPGPGFERGMPPRGPGPGWEPHEPGPRPMEPPHFGPGSGEGLGRGGPPDPGPRMPGFVGDPGSRSFLRLLERVQVSLPIYWLAVCAAQVIGFASRLQARERRAAELEAGLAKARLEALQSQLQPHFLFNTLNAISALILVDPRAADAMLANLSDLLRITLDRRSDRESPLADELAVLERYLEIQKVRFQGRLQVAMEISPECLGAAVPTMILQPIVENALEHGLSRVGEGGTVGIRASRHGDRLRMEVTDNGPGMPAGEPDRARPGIGLSNTRARLAALHGSRGELELRNLQPAGFLVAITIPFRNLEPAPAT